MFPQKMTRVSRWIVGIHCSQLGYNYQHRWDNGNAANVLLPGDVAILFNQVCDYLMSCSSPHRFALSDDERDCYNCRYYAHKSPDTPFTPKHGSCSRCFFTPTAAIIVMCV